MRKLTAAFLCLGVALLGCGKDGADRDGERVARGDGASGSAGQVPADPHAGMGLGIGAEGPTDGNVIPLKQTGVGGAAELAREKAKLENEPVARDLERAFRLTFSTDRSLRDYTTSRQLLLALVRSQPKSAAAYRTLGYAEFSLNPAETGLALQHYNKAVELDPGYGEAHYAIAFMHAATGDRQAGVRHYRRAMELGIADERGIGKEFYGDLLETP